MRVGPAGTRLRLLHQLSAATGPKPTSDVLERMSAPVREADSAVPLAYLCGIPDRSLSLAVQDSGLPLCIQALARQADDDLLLQLAAQIGRAIEGRWKVGLKPRVNVAARAPA